MHKSCTNSIVEVLVKGYPKYILQCIFLIIKYKSFWQKDVKNKTTTRLQQLYSNKWYPFTNINDFKNNYVNPLSTQIFNLNFQSLEVVSRYRDTQLQVTENLCDLWNLGPNIYQGFKLEGIFYF